ncbi:hypothetical protein A4X13_0g963 [Tilletia indica]|uniref:Uncharacterized protein n=1 Tax=Tilletia indica TaxID=43049 RepID=A0A8T8TFM8_9BASI|nr:hypothetical protein A4X13_0g963 [Tilletia indica]
MATRRNSRRKSTADNQGSHTLITARAPKGFGLHQRRQDSRIGGREDGEAKGSEARSTPPIGYRLLSSGLRSGRLHWVSSALVRRLGGGVCSAHSRDASWATGTQRRGVEGRS